VTESLLSNQLLSTYEKGENLYIQGAGNKIVTLKACTNSLSS